MQQEHFAKIKMAVLHGGLFIITFLTATLAGAEWTFGKILFLTDFTWPDYFSGLPYSITLLFILSVHEFGHYYAAVWHRVKTTLPYYIPFYIPFMPFSLGTLGALIRLKESTRTTTQLFDIGLAGPLAGFIVALIVLMYGYTHLPSLEYLFSIHPEYVPYGNDYASYVYNPQSLEQSVINITIGKNLLILLVEKLASPDLIPHPNEMMHYPLLFAGFISLVVTSINLLPIGQLDGGHILYGLLGYKLHRKIASIIFVCFLFYAGLGYISPYEPLSQLLYEIPLMILVYLFAFSRISIHLKFRLMLAILLFSGQFLLASIFPGIRGYQGWLLFAILIGRFIGIAHPPCEIEENLSPLRKVLGWLALLIFIVCFSPNPIEITFL